MKVSPQRPTIHRSKRAGDIGVQRKRFPFTGFSEREFFMQRISVDVGKALGIGGLESEHAGPGSLTQATTCQAFRLQNDLHF